MHRRWTSGDQPDVVDEDFRPFVRAIGNLVITFALAEAQLLDLISEMLGGDERKALPVLKAQDTKEQVSALMRSSGLSGFDLEELLNGIESFWTDKAERNRLIHDEWFPSLFEHCSVLTRGLTRSRTPEQVFGTPTVSSVWQLAKRFQNYDHLFSHRAYMIRRARGGDLR
jgi:hypothetical protein